MIPHHINAMNMAKIALKFSSHLPEFDAGVRGLMVNIIGSQGAQVQEMQRWQHRSNMSAEQTCPTGGRAPMVG